MSSPAGTGNRNGGAAEATVPEPEFKALGARTVRHAATPMLAQTHRIGNAAGR